MKEARPFRVSKTFFAIGFLPFAAIANNSLCSNDLPPSLESGSALVPNGDITADAGIRYLSFPPSAQPVRLYLIDTGVSHKTEWFSRNPNLTFEASYPAGAPTATLHGTRMLDIIAGPETGAVTGTPIKLVSMNVYPSDTSATTVGLVADAIFEAVDRQDLPENRGTPAVICLASGSPINESSAILEHAINSAVAEGITVVVSAGNSGQDASKFIPSKYGTKDGVICAGAYGADLQKLPMSNWGTAVDTFAPGEKVRTLALPAPKPGLSNGMTGTSPAAALTAAAAIFELSRNPSLTPAQVEDALGASVTPPPPAKISREITVANGFHYLDISFVSSQLLTGTIRNGLRNHAGDTFHLEWSQTLQNWQEGRFDDLGAPVEAPGGWRYSARSKVPAKSPVRYADLVFEEPEARVITSVVINDRVLPLPNAPYQLPQQVARLQTDIRAAGLPAATVVASGRGYRIAVPDILYTTPNPNSSVTWPPFVSGVDPLTGSPLISSGNSFSANYHLADGTPVDPRSQYARLRTQEP
jgi:hypothetical protein